MQEPLVLAAEVRLMVAASAKRWTRPDMAQRVDRERLDNFAELIAEGVTITAASKLLGISMQRGSQLFKRIREELGWQAV